MDRYSVLMDLKNLKKKFLDFYLFERATTLERAQAWGGADGEGEADSLLSREPDRASIPGPQDQDMS